MIQEFQELLLSELRMATYEPGLPEQGNDELLCAALTVNENLASLGYTLRPDDIVRLSVSGSLEGFFDRIKALVPDVNVSWISGAGDGTVRSGIPDASDDALLLDLRN